MLPLPSDDQQEIILYFKQGFNCKIEALAGSGKSTALLLLASETKKSFNTKSLILTYNRDLKDELSKKVMDLKLNTHCDVYTYHGYASKIYKQNIYNDVKLRECLTQQPSQSNYDIILLDEVQDMNNDYYQLVRKILSHSKILVLVGDRRQCINEYMGATSDYLINYMKYFDTGRPWKELMLRTSYRLTPSITNFVNLNILCEDLIVSGNQKNRNYKPIYNYGIWAVERLVLRTVERYGPDEVVIMLPSVRNINPKSPVGRLCTKRYSNLMFCIKDGEIAAETMKNKVLITSYNSMKGRERDCVILIGFDESYFEYYDKKWGKNNINLPNVLYVAATRAREQLIIVQDEKKLRLRTIKLDNLFETCQVLGGTDEQKKQKDDIAKRDKIHVVTDLTRHRNTTDTIKLLQLIEIKNVEPAKHMLPYENIIQFNGYYEDMKQYYGIVIPLISQYRKTGETYLKHHDEYVEIKSNKHIDVTVIRRYNLLLEKQDKTIVEWMELVVLNSSILSNCYFYAYQITNYNWVDSTFIETQVKRILDKLQDSNGIFEYVCAIQKEYILQGMFDYFTEDLIWEFKCTTSLSNEHKLQCGAYIALHGKKHNKLLPCNLFNTRTGEIIQITIKDPDEYIKILMENKVLSSIDGLIELIENVEL